MNWRFDWLRDPARPGRSFIGLAAAVSMLMAVHALCAPPPASPAEPWCGTDGGELADLWQQTWLELEALEEMPAAQAWTNAPGRVGMLLAQFATLHRGSTRQGEETLAQVRNAQENLTRLRPRLIGAANSANAGAWGDALAEIRRTLKDLQQQYSPETLRPAPATLTAANLLAGPPTLSVKVSAPRLVTNQPVEVNLRLRDSKGAGVGSLQLLETHTRRLHALVIDLALEDYHHEHPVTSGRPGDFTFVFTPRRPGDYLLWLDVMPLATRRNEMPEAVLPGAVSRLAVAPNVTRMESASQGGWQFVLKLTTPKVKRGQPVDARLRVTDGRGRPSFILEPFMGAFAHVVGFMDDRHTIIHVHAHGEPPHELSRSGPEVPFRFIAPKAGFLKLFAQVQIEGRIQLARFAFPVE